LPPAAKKLFEKSFLELQKLLVLGKGRRKFTAARRAHFFKMGGPLRGHGKSEIFRRAALPFALCSTAGKEPQQ